MAQTVEVKRLYPDQTVTTGDGTAATDCTAGQMLVLAEDNSYSPQTDPTGDVDGMCFKDTLAGVLMPVVKAPAILYHAAVGGSPAYGDSLMVDAAAFPTKHDGNATKTDFGTVDQANADGSAEINFHNAG